VELCRRERDEDVLPGAHLLVAQANLKRSPPLVGAAKQALAEATELCTKHDRKKLGKVAREMFNSIQELQNAVPMSGSATFLSKPARNRGTYPAGVKFDRCIHFSASSTGSGNVGQPNYTGANCFLDGDSHLVRQVRPHVMSQALGWGPVAKIGMRVKAFGNQDMLALTAPEMMFSVEEAAKILSIMTLGKDIPEVLFMGKTASPFPPVESKHLPQGFGGDGNSGDRGGGGGNYGARPDAGSDGKGFGSGHSKTTGRRRNRPRRGPSAGNRHSASFPTEECVNRVPNAATHRPQQAQTHPTLSARRPKLNVTAQTPLSDVLQAARADWRDVKLATILDKLAKVQVETVSELLVALRMKGRQHLNERIKAIGETCFTGATLNVMLDQAKMLDQPSLNQDVPPLNQDVPHVSPCIDKWRAPKVKVQEKGYAATEMQTVSISPSFSTESSTRKSSEPVTVSIKHSDFAKVSQEYMLSKSNVDEKFELKQHGTHFMAFNADSLQQLAAKVSVGMPQAAAVA